MYHATYENLVLTAVPTQDDIRRIPMPISGVVMAS
jgi:hypothetical protein